MCKKPFPDRDTYKRDKYALHPNNHCYIEDTNDKLLLSLVIMLQKDLKQQLSKLLTFLPFCKVAIHHAACHIKKGELIISDNYVYLVTY